MFWTKIAHQSTVFQTFECFDESSTDSSCHFWNYKVRFYSSFASVFSVMKDNSLQMYSFVAQTLYTLNKKSPSKRNFQLFFFYFFFFKPCITFKCNERKLYRTFLAETLYDLDKKNPLNSKILDFQLLT